MPPDAEGMPRPAERDRDGDRYRARSERLPSGRLGRDGSLLSGSAAVLRLALPRDTAAFRQPTACWRLTSLWLAALLRRALADNAAARRQPPPWRAARLRRVIARQQPPRWRAASLRWAAARRLLPLWKTAALGRTTAGRRRLPRRSAARHLAHGGRVSLRRSGPRDLAALSRAAALGRLTIGGTAQRQLPVWRPPPLGPTQARSPIGVSRATPLGWLAALGRATMLRRAITLGTLSLRQLTALSRAAAIVRIPVTHRQQPPPKRRLNPGSVNVPAVVA